ncbi:MAG: CvpA family protein [Lachnospiraceae bacterium]|nr:CvpA family protein [Lachnospiraceae bacterium]
MKKRGHLKWKLLALLTVIVIGFIYYYITLPAINIHNKEFWTFILVLIAILIAMYVIRKKVTSIGEIRENKVLKSGVILMGLLLLILLVGTLLSSPIVNAKKYQSMMVPEERDFTEDIPQISFDQIPILDRDSAVLLGNRKMGSMIDMVSQFEVSELYSQINYQGDPVRVSPLIYASTIKWFTNQADGIPAYMMIDMANQDTTLVKLDKPIKYSESEHLNRNIYRHLRFRFPTYIFDQISFEIDDDGVPYWVCPVSDYTIGLFGGRTIGRVVLCNAQTGETQDYAIGDCPQWVDRAYPADLLLQLYNYHGTLNNGFINSVFGQKGCLKTTEGYNYIAMDDDVWVYTGITSVNSDQSNVGFLLINQRTMETRYYGISGAEEFSAMGSAEGQVQNLGYKAAFPLLLNIANEPTYILALKDDAGLVKKYAMVNVEKYQDVSIGDTISECQTAYVKMLKATGNTSGTVAEVTEKAVGTISRMATSVIDGNSHYYLVLEGNDKIFDVSVADLVQIVRYAMGDQIKLEYVEGDPTCTVTEIVE